jgi:3',5'-nucleoside bisphosphate phosphatase
MNRYSADLHIHTVLSPCGDLEMSPVNIVDRAVERGLDIIAITDHNHTGHARLTRALGTRRGLWVVYGAEVTTREEVHCLTFFDTEDQLDRFQVYLDRNRPLIPNDIQLFGHQVIVDEEEQIIAELERSLYPAMNKGIDEVTEFVHSIGGLFVPAHVDRRMNGLYSQLGFLPVGLDLDAIEIFRQTDREAAVKEHPELKDFELLKSSDAHFIGDVGRCTSTLLMDQRSFKEFRMALRGLDGRGIDTEPLDIHR